MSSGGEVLLQGLDLEKTYEMGDRGLKVLRGVSIEVRRGEILAIQGPSGAGKSTLLHLMGLLDEPDRGSVVFKGEDLLKQGNTRKQRYRNRDIGFVFQFYHLFPDLTAFENVCLPRMVGLGSREYARERSRIEDRARRLIDIVGLSHRLEHRPSELSGGERQRVAIARALMNEPEVLLCDEPTGNLDQKTAADVLDLLWRLNREQGQTFVIVTHDEGLATRADRIVRVVDGALSDGGPPKPRGFAETKFPLREPAERLKASALAAGLLTAIIPGYFLWWSRAVNARFYRATRRGWSGLGAAVLGVLTLVPGLSLWPVHAKPLAAADRILRANEARPIGAQRYVPIWLFSFALTALIGAVIVGAQTRIPGSHFKSATYSTEVVAAIAIAQAALGAAAGYLQSLHNTFFDRMRPQ